MREFIVKARAAPVDPARFRRAAGQGARVEYLAHCLINGLLVSKSHRDDTRVTLVLEDSDDYSRAIEFDGSILGSLPGTSEEGWLDVCAQALAAGGRLKKEESVPLSNGVSVRAISFEHLVKEKLADTSVYRLDRKGEDIRSIDIGADSVILLNDHVPVPRKTVKSLDRQGVVPIHLGPRVLHASQCITLVHNELDRREGLGNNSAI